MLTKDDVVYKLELEDRKPVLRFVLVATRGVATHDQAADLPDIPEIFFPVSTAGMKQAVWKANCLPMIAMGAMFDAGYSAFEDIDRLEMLAAQKVKDQQSEAFAKLLAAFATKAREVLEASGAYKGPWPIDVATSILLQHELTRRKQLAVNRMLAARG